MKRRPLTELEAVAMRDAQANAEAYFTLRDELDAAEKEIEALRDAVAEAHALLSEAGPLIGATAGWPGRRAAWLEENAQ